MTITELNTARYHGIGLTDLQILLLLAEHGPLDISDLAGRIGLTQAAISHAGKRLIAKHLIHVADRRHDLLRDRRAVWLDLGELGRVRIHQITGTFPEVAAGTASL
jgi:DNA-binding MarR family transcriptional regulator